MDAVEYLRQRRLLCETQEDLHPDDGLEYCSDCPLGTAYPGACRILENHRPAEAVRIVEEWADAKRYSGGIRLSAMDERFVRLYIEKGYFWAARNKNGELWLYIKEPARGEDKFTLESPALFASRLSYPHMLPTITWENSPVCLPRLLEGRER